MFKTAGLREPSVSILLAPPAVGRSRTWEVGKPHQRSTAPRGTHPAVPTNFLHVPGGLDMECEGDVLPTASSSGSNISGCKHSPRPLPWGSTWHSLPPQALSVTRLVAHVSQTSPAEEAFPDLPRSGPGATSTTTPSWSGL